ncbi:MAG: hypothetical protein KBD03_03100 [Gammaproteobacteria bacterium]|nr:hypothetical protein [Gammaproteobacteria bacterium]
MGKLKDKLKKVEQNVRHAIKEVEPAIRHAIQKIDVRATLSPYRKAAQDALESAEKELTEMNVVLATAQSIETDTKARLERLPLAGSEDDQKFVSERVNIIRSGVQKLSDAQTQVAGKEAVVRTERGNVSSIPNEVENSEHAEADAKAASSKAISEAAVISSILAQARTELLNIQAVQREIIARIEAVDQDVKETRDTQELQLTQQTSQGQVTSVVKEEPPMPEENKNVQEVVNVAGYRIPVAQPAHQAQPLVGQEQFGIDNVELDPVHEVLKAEAAAVEAAAPPHCGAELPPQGAANEAEDLPPEYEPNLEVVVHIEQHIESKAQAEDPQAAMIRQLQEQMAAIQQQFAALLAQQQGGVQIEAVASPSPVVTPLRALHAEANIAGDNVPAPVSQRPGEASSCP